MPFEKIETKKKSAYIIEQIVSAIRNGEYSNGQKLPSEREIAVKMGVSRPSVREAFSALQIAGIIESRSGDGTYIKGSGNWGNMKSQALDILKNDEDPYLVLEAREAIECGSAKIAANNATTEDIARTKEALEVMEEASDNGNYHQYFESDRDFHLAIALCTHNPFLKQTIRSLGYVMKQRLWKEVKQKYYFGKPEKIKESFEIHKRIFVSVRNRKPKCARKAMENHFDELKKHLIK